LLSRARRAARLAPTDWAGPGRGRDGDAFDVTPLSVGDGDVVGGVPGRKRCRGGAAPATTPKPGHDI